MGRTTSGGVRLPGGRIIEFGAGVLVDTDAAKERADRGRERMRMEREESGRLEGLGISGVRR